MNPARQQLQDLIGQPMHRFRVKQAKAVVERILELQAENSALKAKLSRWGRPKNAARIARKVEASNAPVLVFDPKTGEIEIQKGPE